MITYILRYLFSGDYREKCALEAAHPRSPQWAAFRREMLKKLTTCAATGTTKWLELHHVKPFHLFPELELEPTNIICLTECRSMLTIFLKTHYEAHFDFGHTLDGHSSWSVNNPNVRADAAKNLARVNALKALSPGKYWKVDGSSLDVFQAFTVDNGKGNAETIPVGFQSDGYTGVWDCPDEAPAIAHDRAYTFQRWDDGTIMTFPEANDLLYYLMSISESWCTRRLAYAYWAGVSIFGRKFWRAGVKFTARPIFRRKSRFRFPVDLG